MQIVLRAASLFVFVWVVTRALGRKELSELGTFDLILLIVMGDLIQQGVTGDDRSVTGAMLAVATMGLLVVGLSYVSFRWTRAQRVLEGTPVLIVNDGRPIEEVMRIERLTLDEVKDAAREQGIDDLADVDVGVLESDGKFSFIRRDRARPPRGQQESPAR
jgi:uncharacterized membrane protein YcaP (DUF421 family)